MGHPRPTRKGAPRCAAHSPSRSRPAPPSEAPSEGSPTECGISSSSSVITDAVDALEPPSGPGTYWSYEGDSNYDPCADLSYALLVQQPQGNAQFGTQMLFFHRGEYTGIDSTHPQQVMDIEDHGNRLVVTYKTGKLWKNQAFQTLRRPISPRR